MYERDRSDPYKGREIRVQQGTLDANTPERVRSIQHDEADLRIRGRLHGELHCADIGIKTDTDVLNVEDERIDPLEHLGRGCARIAVEAVHGDRRKRTRGDFVPRRHIPAITMLR